MERHGQQTLRKRLNVTAGTLYLNIKDFRFMHLRGGEIVLRNIWSWLLTPALQRSNRSGNYCRGRSLLVFGKRLPLA